MESCSGASGAVAAHRDQVLECDWSDAAGYNSAQVDIPR